MLVSGLSLLSQTEAVSAPAAVAANEMSIGETIVALRRERGLTLQECAKVSGVAASTLSKIERNELSPTISTLQKIASGFGMDAAELLSPSRASAAPGRRAVTRRGDGKGHTSQSCQNMLLCGDLKNKRMVPVRTRITARSTDEYPVWPKSDAEIFLWVVSGVVLVHSHVYEPLELRPGDSVYYDGSAAHCWTSVGPEDAEVIWVLSA